MVRYSSVASTLRVVAALGCLTIRSIVALRGRSLVSVSWHRVALVVVRVAPLQRRRGRLRRRSRNTLRLFLHRLGVVGLTDLLPRLALLVKEEEADQEEEQEEADDTANDSADNLANVDAMVSGRGRAWCGCLGSGASSGIAYC